MNGLSWALEIPETASSCSEDGDFGRLAEEAAHEGAFEACFQRPGAIVVTDAAQDEHPERRRLVDRSHLGHEVVEVGTWDRRQGREIERSSPRGRRDQLQLDAIDDRADAADGPIATERRNEDGRGKEAGADHRHVDLVVLAAEGARPIGQQPAHDLDRFGVPIGALAGGRVVDAGSDRFVAVPARSQPGFEPATRHRLHLQRGLGELDRRAEEVVGERCREADP